MFKLKRVMWPKILTSSYDLHDVKQSYNICDRWNQKLKNVSCRICLERCTIFHLSKHMLYNKTRNAPFEYFFSFLKEKLTITSISYKVRAKSEAIEILFHFLFEFVNFSWQFSNWNIICAKNLYPYKKSENVFFSHFIFPINRTQTNNWIQLCKKNHHVFNSYGTIPSIVWYMVRWILLNC